MPSQSSAPSDPGQLKQRIHIVDADANEKGDLLTDRIKDVVHALGFNVESTNLHRTGRELDIVAWHRLENVKLVAECKAQAAKVGGADVNKFVGALDAERNVDSDVRGYFISLSGFKDSAHEQERNIGRQRCVLMGADEIQQELVAANILCRPEVAIANFARLLEREHAVHPDPAVVMSERGWLYVLHGMYLEAPSAIGFANSSGRILTEAEARNELDRLTSFPAWCTGLPLLGAMPSVSPEFTISSKYLDYITREYGVIRHEGLPLDAEYGAGRPVRLEQLYIDQVLESLEENHFVSTAAGPSSGGQVRPPGTTAGEALSAHLHICVLGPPGSGKSTLIKHLAYDAAAKFRESPENMYPVVVRCRDLPAAWRSISDVLAHLPSVAELPAETEQFSEFVQSRADRAQLLLLIDGLDEIIDAAERRRFSIQLRTFLARYPRVSCLITSREAGFRLVADSMSEYVEKYRVSELSTADVAKLTRAWFAHIYGDSTQDTDRAIAVAESICNDWRLRRLASTPLLLTMLLLIQRWTGGSDLPKRRSVLYRRAIEVLLSTWNVEAHHPLSLDEALPQLAYVAHWMTTRGEQRVSFKAMVRTIQGARSAMPDVLGYAQQSPADFLSSIEARSSLIIQAGFEQYDGEVLPAIEFRHRVFQDYLVALAITEGWLDDFDQASLTTALSAHLGDPAWFEIIELVSVISGRRGSEVLDMLHDKLLATDELLANATSSEEVDRIADVQRALADLIRGCLCDDAQVSPSNAVRHINLLCDHFTDPMHFEGILDSRYEDLFTKVVGDNITTPRGERYINADVYIFLVRNRTSTLEVVARQIGAGLQSPIAAGQASALQSLLQVCYSYSQPDYVYELNMALTKQEVASLAELHAKQVVELASNSKEDLVRRNAIWSLAWISEHLDITSLDTVALSVSLVEVLFSSDTAARGFAGWVLAKLFIAGAELGLSSDHHRSVEVSDRLQAIIKSGVGGVSLTNEDAGFMVLAYYMGHSDREQVARVLEPRFDQGFTVADEPGDDQ